MPVGFTERLLPGELKVAKGWRRECRPSAAYIRHSWLKLVGATYRQGAGLRPLCLLTEA